MTTSDSLEALRRKFAEQLPERIMAIRERYRESAEAGWTQATLDALHQALHSLTGSAGTFGMMSVSAAARQLEIRVKDTINTRTAPDEPTWQHIGTELERIEKLVRGFRDSDAPKLTPPQPIPRLDRVPLVYLVEDDLEQADHLAQALREDGYTVRVFTDLEKFHSAIREEDAPDAVVLDMIFPDGDFAGAQKLAQIKAEWKKGPPVIFVSVRDDLEARLAAYRAGATRYMLKPVAPEALLDVLDAVTGRMPPEPYRVLLVDDDPLLMGAQAGVLSAAGMTVQSLSDPRKTLNILDTFRPDVVVLDVYMPDVSGPEIAAVIRESDNYLTMPILFLSAETDLSQQLLALNLGGDDFLVKPVQPHHLVSAVTARARRARQNAALLRRLKTSLYERDREHLALNHHAIVSIADRKGDITYVNDRFCDISGYSRDELIGQNHRILKSGEHPQAFYDELWQTIASGRIWHGDICNRRKDGSLYWVTSTIAPFMDDRGKPYQYVSIRTDITHVKHTERALEHHKERLRLGQQYANVGTWEWNIVSGELFWTERIPPLFGYPEGGLETSYDNFLAAVHPDDRQAVIDAVAACLDHDAPYDIEHRVVWPDGTERWLLERGAVKRNAEGDPLFMLGVVQDIDDRKRAELALAERERQLLEAQSLASIGNWSADLSSGALVWSDEIYRIFGHEPRSFAPSVEAFRAAVHPDDLELLIESERQAEKTGRHDVAHRILRPDGSIRYVHELAQMYLDEEGKPLRLTGTVQDVTERKTAEQTLRLFKHVVDSVLDGVLVIDPTGAIRLANPAASGIFGYEQKAMLDNNISMLMPEPHRSEHNAYLRRYMTTGQGRIINRQIEVTGKRADGDEFPLEVSVSEIHIEKDRFFVGLFRDITLRKQDEAALVVAREEADRANQAKSEFLSSMSHELRTPMNAILGFGQLMESEETLSDEQQDNVKEILKAGQHLLTLINEVLDLAKIESGRVDLSLEAVGVRPVIEECLSLVAEQAKRRTIRLSQEAVAAVAVRADRTRLKQVLLNLLSNAIKYNRDGGSVQIDTQPTGEGRLRIRVRDSGAGIAPDRLEELFQPFNRLDAENSEIEGTGIGLTITRRIVEMMGGAVDVESEVGIGSTFWIELPLEFLAEEDGGIPASSPRGKALAKDADGGQTVLYIEDNPANLKLVAKILGHLPHIHLLTAHSSELGIELALARRPALILLDINMPGMDGYQVLAFCKAEASLKEIPIIAVTANARPSDIDRGIAAGFAGYITKPINISDFHDEIKRHLFLRKT